MTGVRSVGYTMTNSTPFHEFHHLFFDACIWLGSPAEVPPMAGWLIESAGSSPALAAGVRNRFWKPDDPFRFVSVFAKARAQLAEAVPFGNPD